MEDSIGLPQGSILHGAYRIESILGQGGFGITYLAYEMRLDRYVAIKEFFPKDFCDRDQATTQVVLGSGNTKELVETLKAKFLREAKYIAHLDYPGIIKIHTAFEENRTAYYVMDYIEGVNLSQLVKKRIASGEGPVPEKEALRYVRMVGEALVYLHSHSMNHFDVKPANILVRQSDDRPILIDFGLSKQYDDSDPKATTTIMGMSQGYAPMEQYVAGGVKEFSPQTDLYSLAATLFYLLSGIAPPDAPSLADQELTFPAQIPVRLIGPISKAMSTSRADRHASVAEFLEDINSIDSPTEPNLTPPKKSLWRNSWIWFVAALAIGFSAWVIRNYMTSEDTPINVTTESETTTSTPETIEGYLWVSPLGRCVYSGSVVTDPESGMKIPDGKGIARILEGEYAGCTYDGEIHRGTFEGKTVYTYSNGDTFEGTFINNEYDEGKYTIKESGEYFVGKFKDGADDIGSWYDRNGNKKTE